MHAFAGVEKLVVIISLPVPAADARGLRTCSLRVEDDDVVGLSVLIEVDDVSPELSCLVDLVHTAVVVDVQFTQRWLLLAVLGHVEEAVLHQVTAVGISPGATLDVFPLVDPPVALVSFSPGLDVGSVSLSEEISALVIFAIVDITTKLFIFLGIFYAALSAPAFAMVETPDMGRSSVEDGVDLGRVDEIFKLVLGLAHDRSVHFPIFTAAKQEDGDVGEILGVVD